MSNPNHPEPPHFEHAMHRLSAVDLRNLSESEHAALRQGAIGAGVSFPGYLGKLITESSKRLLGAVNQTQTPTA